MTKLKSISESLKGKKYLYHYAGIRYNTYPKGSEVLSFQARNEIVVAILHKKNSGTVSITDNKSNFRRVKYKDLNMTLINKMYY